ncbi:protein-L-isoaspartate(D-aspartate) O-methyltransferase [Candidatus Woesearchaeota archaeon]|nr:protein-L-isoaspartate(D-aspartate) O-methyltransferase [Candidatus Woesearchaeota archaeon]
MVSKQSLINFWKENFSFTEEEIKTFSEVKREDFVPEQFKDNAYDDSPLPILRGKTISQPTTVMMMTSALKLRKNGKVFEVGTGSGYQTAIISKIVGDKGKVVSAEVIPELVIFARNNLKKSGINNVKVIEEDGSKGYKQEAPFDRIILTAASREFPKELLEQLKPEGIIVGPVGSSKEQEMVRGRKDKNGKLELEFLGQFLFSPLSGKYGFAD